MSKSTKNLSTNKYLLSKDNKSLIIDKFVIKSYQKLENKCISVIITIINIDEDGIVTGEYGFITADGIYHETGYATDKEGDFIITKMRNRKLTSSKIQTNK